MTQQRPVLAMTPPSGLRRVFGYYWGQRRVVGIGLAALLATNLLTLLVPTLFGRVIDMMRGPADLWGVARIALVVSVIAVFAAVARVVSRIHLFNASRACEHELRCDLFAHMSRLQASYFGSNAVGDLVTRATNDVANVRMMLGFGVLTVVNTALVFLGNLPLLFVLDVPLAFAALAPTPLLLLVARLGSRTIYRRSQKLQLALSDLSSRITENLAGMRVVRSLGREDAELEAFSRLNDIYYRESIRLSFARNLLWPASGLVFGFGTIAVLWFGGLRVMDSRISVGEFVEFNTRLAILAWPTLALGWVIGTWQRGRASMDRLDEIFNSVPRIKDAENAIAHCLRGGIRAEHLSVRYTDNAEPALHDICFEISAGTSLGVVGKTGSGKTTLARALARLVDVEPGQLFFDDVDVTHVQLQALRSSIAFAEQEAQLFSTSLRENIRYAHPSAQDAEVDLVVDCAQLRLDVESMPEGLETVVGERGIILSGGQRQRAALARALLKPAPIIVLDDSLASVDTETEQRIQVALDKLHGQRTVVQIAHRLSAVRHSDHIIVLDAGYIIEQGTHLDLLQQNGVYAQLWQRQADEHVLQQRQPTT